VSGISGKKLLGTVLFIRPSTTDKPPFNPFKLLQPLLELEIMLLRRIPRALGRLGCVTRRHLSSRAQRVLSAVDLPIDEQPIPGVFDGEWYGRGEILESQCPATGEVIGRVRSVSANMSLFSLD